MSDHATCRHCRLMEEVVPGARHLPPVRAETIAGGSGPDRLLAGSGSGPRLVRGVQSAGFPSWKEEEVTGAGPRRSGSRRCRERASTSGKSDAFTERVARAQAAAVTVAVTTLM